MPSSHRRRPARVTAAPAAGAATTSLRMPLKPDRLTALLHTHHRLLDKIKVKRRELQRLEERVQTTMTAASSRLQPVTAEIAQLDGELHTLFAELLGNRRLSRSASAALKDLYRTLQQSGMMSPQPSAAPPPRGKAEGKNARTAEESAPPPPAEAHAATARRPGDNAANQSLRALFRRLAEALHPDKVQLEEEKLRRTEAMKEITRAYQDGDIARLLELERRWLSGSALAAPGDELDRRCALLMQTNTALQVQLDELLDELKELRRSPQAALMHDFARTAQVSGKDPIDAMIAGAKEDRERLRELVRSVGAFRDGKISLKELLGGPRPARRPEADDPNDVDAFLDQLFEETADTGPRRGKKRRRAAPSSQQF